MNDTARLYEDWSEAVKDGVLLIEIVHELDRMVTFQVMSYTGSYTLPYPVVKT